jgi:regulator of replication initiation timing
MQVEKTAPREAFQFSTDWAIQAPEKIDGKSSLRAFSGTAYNGGTLKHPWWGRLMIDLATTRAAENRIPVLKDHDEEAGYTTSVRIDSKITVEGKLLSFGAGARIAQAADEGFPWQQSVGIFPDDIHFLEPGQSMLVNGQNFEGPGAVFRQAMIRETSFTSLGVDGETNAQAFSEHAQQQFSYRQHGGQAMPDPSNPDNAGRAAASQQSLDTVLAQLAQLQTDQAGIKTQLTAITTERDQLKTQVEKFQQAETERLAAERTTAVKKLEQDMGLEFSDEQRKQYQALSGEAFVVIRGTVPERKSSDDPALFTQFSQQNDDPEDGQKVDVGGNVVKLTDPVREKLHAKALAFQQTHAGTDYLTAYKAVGGK